VKGVGDAAAAATTQAAPLGPAVAAIGTAATTAAAPLTALETASKTAQAALDKLGNVTGIRGLSISIVQAQMAMETFKKAATDAEAAGTKMSPAISASLKTMQGDITNATQRLGDLRKAQTDLGATSALAGSQLDKLRMSGTSLSGMFQSMEQTGGGLTKAVGQMGMSLGIAGIAFMGAKLAGEQLGKAIDFVAQKNQLLADTHNKTRASAELHAAAMLALNKGLIANSDTVAGLIKNYELYNLSHGRAMLVVKEHADKVLGLNAALLTEKEIVAQSEESAARLAGIEEEATRATALVTTAETNLATVRATMPEKIGRVMDAEIALSLAKENAGKKQAEYNLAIEKAGPVILAEVAAYRALGDAMPPALRKASAALDELKKKHDDATEAMKKAIETAKNLPAAMQNSIDSEKKLSDSAKLVADSHDKLIPEIQKVLAEYEKEIARGGSVEAANIKAAAALAAYGTAHKLSAIQVAEMVTAQGDLVAKLNAATAKLTEQIGQVGLLGGAMTKAAAQTETLAEMQLRLQAAYEHQRDEDITTIHDRNAKAMEAEAKAALALADAFGRVAGGLTEISATADNATAGLQAVAWEMRSATKETFTLNDSENALVESLAKVADQYGKTSLWVEHLLSQFEKGTVSLADFRKQLADMLLGMKAMPGAFGDTSVQMNRMLTLLDKFKNTASNGWPVGTTTAPYSNPSNTLTGKP
jgi:hypothetical protein